MWKQLNALQGLSVALLALLSIVEASLGGGAWEVWPYEDNESSLPRAYQDIIFTTTSFGFAVGYADGSPVSLLKTSNGGATWNPVEHVIWEESLGTLLAIDFVDEQHGVIAGQTAFAWPWLIWTDDAWVDWPVQAHAQPVYEIQNPNSGHEARLEDVVLTAPDTAWSAAHIWNNNGALLYHERDEEQWTTIHWSDHALRAIDFDSTYTYGMVVGWSGTIYATIDGGQTWNSVETNLAVDFEDVAVVAPDAVWVVGTSGTIIYSDDFGKTWHEIKADLQANLLAIDVWQETLIRVAGTGGVIAMSDDGGYSWSKELTPVRQPLKTIRHLHHERAFAGGADDIILGYDETATGDLNGDGTVGVEDLLIMLQHWGNCPKNVACPADLNQDGTVDASDLLILIHYWSG